MDPYDRLGAALTRCGVVDDTPLTRLVATGPDILDLLHRLGTGDVKTLTPGEGRATVLTNAKGRIVERLFVHHLGADGILVVGGPGSAERTLGHLRKFTFAERLDIVDRTEATCAFTIVGPEWRRAALAASLPELVPYGVAPFTVGGAPVHVLRQSGFDANGVMIVGARDAAGKILDLVREAAESVGGAVLDPSSYEAWRIISGLPAMGAELTEDRNPLEAGLRDAVSFTKGCYVGQEVIARLNTYDKVSRELLRLELPPGSPTPARGATVRWDGRDVGTITSAAQVPGRDFVVAIASVKSRVLPPGTGVLTVDVGEAEPSPARINR
jgi:folate-binding protein YgfZ